MEITKEKKSIWGKDENNDLMPHNGSVLYSFTPKCSRFFNVQSPGPQWIVAIILISILQMEKNEDLNIKPFGQDNTAVR